MTDFSGHSAAEAIKQKAKCQPRVAIVLGSGLGELAESVEDPAIISYEDLPGFPPAGVAGHAGQLILGKLGGIPVACMQGRMHYYEGHNLQALALPVRAMKQSGCEILILTNAAGSLRGEMGPGSLMLITDHINFVGNNPLIGANDDAIGPRFFDMSEAYDLALRENCLTAAKARGIELSQGVYAWYSGPNFETPAEIRALARLGADAVGMSTVPECLAARHCGLRVVAISNITNLAAGMSKTPLSHEETLANATEGANKLETLIIDVLPEIA